MAGVAPEADGPLAQLVEQRTLNPLVVGSIPTRPTNKLKGLASARPLFFSEGPQLGIGIGIAGPIPSPQRC
jgi:hypothetical protein